MDPGLIKLFVSGLMSYGIGVIYQLCMQKQSIHRKHLYNLSLGLALCYFNFGIHTIHSLITCFTVYCTIQLLGPTALMVAINFVFCMSYLLIGYYGKFVVNDTSITWTMPQCVLTLALIAVSFDIYDGHQNLKNGKKLNEDSAIERQPTLLEFLAKMYFPSTFLIGPQLKMKDYRAFVELNNENTLTNVWKRSLIRFLSGMIYLAIFLTVDQYWSVKYFLTDEFKSYGFFGKIALITIINKIFLYKYISAWLLAEGACIIYGITTYHQAISKDEQLLPPYDHCCNVSIFHYETSATFRGLIESFNITTNQFALKYIYKRLKWFKSKLLSNFITLLFLALWHGFSIGYYNTFLLEFLMMKLETEIANKVIKYRTSNQQFNQILNNITIRWIIYIAMRLHVTMMLSYALISFALLNFNEWTTVLSQIYYFGHIIYAVLFIMSILFNSFDFIRPSIDNQSVNQDKSFKMIITTIRIHTNGSNVFNVQC